MSNALQRWFTGTFMASHPVFCSVLAAILLIESVAPSLVRADTILDFDSLAASGQPDAGAATAA